MEHGGWGGVRLPMKLNSTRTSGPINKTERYIGLFSIRFHGRSINSNPAKFRADNIKNVERDYISDVWRRKTRETIVYPGP